MAEKKTGPVKPPVIDLEAREAGDGANGGAGNPENSGGKTKQTRRRMWDWRRYVPRVPLAPIATGFSGAVLGLGSAFGLAALGFWPQPDAGISERNASGIAALEQRFADIESLKPVGAADLADIEKRLDAIETFSSAEIAKFGQSIDALKTEIAALAAQPAAGEPVDLDPLTSEIANLKTRLDAIASRASSSDSGMITGEVSRISGDIENLDTRLADLESSVHNLGEAGAAIRSTVDELSAANASGGALRMPLALSGFEAAIDAGKPFEAELAALATDLPGLVVPPELAQSATNGLPPPESVASGLSTAVPAMLAARPADHDASWQQRIADRAAAFLALRPSGDAEGDGPDAIIARIESAVARRDFIAADKNFSMLPEPMRAAAQNAGKDIAALAAAERFAARARTEALAPRTGTPQ